MTDNQIQLAMEQIMRLWPEAKLPPAAADVWKARLRVFDPELLRLAINDAYAETKRQTPYLSDLLGACRKRGMTFRVEKREQRNDAYAEQVREEEAQDRFLLSNWESVHLDGAKAEILKREPGLALAFGRLKSSNPMWLHLILSRMVDKMVYVPDGKGGFVAVPVADWWRQKRGAVSGGVLA